MVEAPLTMACINPARDLGPHIAISILGWGAAAFPGVGRPWWIWTVGPILGALAGGVAWSLAVQDIYQATRRTGGMKSGQGSAQLPSCWSARAALGRRPSPFPGVQLVRPRDRLVAARSRMPIVIPGGC
jgi:hypothetical protein